MIKLVKIGETIRWIEERSGKLWVRLPHSVVQARAGLNPSHKTDGNRPPEGLTANELLMWYRGLPVRLKTKYYPPPPKKTIIVRDVHSVARPGTRARDCTHNFAPERCS